MSIPSPFDGFRLRSFLKALLGLWICLSPALAEDGADDPAPAPEAVAAPVVTITDKWSVLVNPGRPRPGIVEFTEKSPLKNVTEFKLTGPMVGHAFGLGEFAIDGHWAVAHGAVQVTEGKNALLSLAMADQFELEGIINQEGFGGWLIVLGWHQGHGYTLSNFTLKESGSPWFFCEYENAEAITATNSEVKQFEWKGDQPFRMTVKEKQLSVVVGKTPILEAYPLDNYTAGHLCLGTYDTRYGPRPLKVRSLRIRALADKPQKPEKPPKAAPPVKKGKTDANAENP